jgi:putative transposase
MKRSKRTWTVEEKVSILKEAEEKGSTLTCRKYGIYPSLFAAWREKYEREGPEGLKPQYVKRNEREIQQLKNENSRLKLILADKELELQMKTELLKKKMQQWKNGGK